MRVTAFRVLTGLAAAVALGFFGFGVAVVADDLQQSGEMLDGLGVVIGLGLMLVSTLAAVLSVLAIVVVRRSPLVARVIGVLLALTGLGLLYPPIVDRGWTWAVVLVPVALLAVSVLPDEWDGDPSEPPTV